MMISVVKRVARPDDISEHAGSSEDHRVTHLQISKFTIRNMGVISNRYKNIDTLELIKCKLDCVPDFDVWSQKRKLRCIMCTPGETADALYNALIGTDAVERVVCANSHLMRITWKIDRGV